MTSSWLQWLSLDRGIETLSELLLSWGTLNTLQWLSLDRGIETIMDVYDMHDYVVAMAVPR